MKNTNRIWKIVFFAVMLAVLLSLAVAANAESNPCAVRHAGPFSYRNTVNATCTVDGTHEKWCDACNTYITTEPIIAQGHKPPESRANAVKTVLKEATCEEAGEVRYDFYCRVCSQYIRTETDYPAALGHLYGAWQVETPATCEGEGTEVSICARNNAHKQHRNYGPLNHLWDNGTIIKQPDCTNQGIKKYTCQRDSSHTYNEYLDIIPDAHKWNNGAVITPATCSSTGLKRYTCTINSTHIRDEVLPIDSNAHQWGTPRLDPAPDCETPGKRITPCLLNHAHDKIENIPATGHKWDGGKIIVPPTFTTPGTKLYTCENNNNHTYTENLGTLVLSNNTVCAFGPMLRDTNLYPYDTDLWYMFTPFDASKDGKQTYELVASNYYIVGEATLEIKDGFLTIDYKLRDTRNFTITLEFFTVLNKISDITKYEPEDLLDLRLNKNQPINLAEKYGDDTNLVLYFCSRCNYSYSSTYTVLNYNSKAHQDLLKSMLALMD